MKTLLISLIFAGVGWCQLVPAPSIIYITTDPTGGSCVASYNLQNKSTGVQYSCVLGLWTAISGGGGGGGGTVAGYTTITFSATPVFAVTSTTVEFQILTLTGNVTSSAITVASGNPRIILSICQDSTGGRTIVMPTHVLNMGPVNTTANYCTKGVGTWNGTDLIVETTSIALASGAPLSGAVELPGSTSGLTILGVPDAAGASHRINFPTAKGTSNQVLATNGGTPEQTSWIDQTGGTGAAILSGAYGSLPGTCTVNDLYIISSGIFNFARCTGTDVFSFFYRGYIVTPAAQLSLTTLAGGAPAPDALTSSSGFESMTRSSGGGAAYSLRYWAAPGATPYTYHVVTLPPPNLFINAGYKQFAVGFMDSSGKSFLLTCGQGTAVVNGYFCRSLNVNADGSVNAEVLGYATAIAGVSGEDLTFVARDDGTNINLGFSTNGTDYYFTFEARASFLSAPSRITYGMEVTTADQATMSMVGVY